VIVLVFGMAEHFQTFFVFGSAIILIIILTMFLPAALDRVHGREPGAALFVIPYQTVFQRRDSIKRIFRCSFSSSSDQRSVSLPSKARKSAPLSTC
jgi:hypothetical protein